MADREGYIRGLRELADWYEAHPDAEAPLIPVATVIASTKDELAQWARWLAPCRKGAIGDTLIGVARQFGPISFAVSAYRTEVCTRRVVGTEEIPERTVPAHTKEIVEWECPSFLNTND